jgi:dTDP-4-dehydrorhamnose 3,5-epimerase
MIIRNTTLEGVEEINLYKYEDHRGTYLETYNQESYDYLGVNWVQDDFSVSRKDVLRGIHGDKETYKLITCVYGKIYLVIVDCREGHDAFGEWQSFIISGDNGVQVFVPPERGVAHLVLTEDAVFSYKQSTYYNREKQFTYRFDDSRFGIWWPIKNPILSERDAKRNETDYT